MGGASLVRAQDDLDEVEMELLLEGIYRYYGFDFRGYARSSLRRRLWRRVHEEGTGTLSGLLERVLHDPPAMERLLLDLSISVTSMFRDPSFYARFRDRVVPLLRTYPFIRIWNAGCSSGEETYSLAILLEEEGLYERSRIYATDINEAVLERAKRAAFPLENMRSYTENYVRAGGRGEFSGYYAANGRMARFRESLGRQIVFAQHNLVSDGIFNDFHLIVCRNVMIYFGTELQASVHRLFFDSLEPFGVLALGQKESIRHSPYAARFEELDGAQKLYRKVPS